MLAFLLAVALTVAAPTATGSTPGGSISQVYQLLTNPGLESYDSPYGQFQGIDLQVASGWQRFWYGGAEPYWMDGRVFANSHLGGGWVDRIEGDTAQFVFSTEPYTAGIRQQVSGLTPGVAYGFHAALLTIFKTSAQDPVDGKMIKQVGMDPTGGTDPQAATVVWSDADDHDQGPWSLELRTSVFAEAPTLTVFIRVDSPYPSGDLPFLNLSFLDSAILARTPIITATSPAVSSVPTFTVSWDNAVQAPGCVQLKWMGVQWLDEEEGVWRGWLTGTLLVQADFVGQRGHTYRFRARVWQKYLNGAWLHSPYRAEGDTRTVVQGSSLAGRVLSPDGLPASGAMVAVADTGNTTKSGIDGRYELNMPAGPEPQTVMVSHPFWLATAPLYDVTLGPIETRPFTWTLRPPDDAVTNGEFEAGLEGWHPVGLAPDVVAQPVHTGHSALKLGGTAGVTFTSGVTQSAVLTDSWEPVLSFWYNPVETGGDDRFNVVLTMVSQAAGAAQSVTVTQVLTPTLDVTGWTHLAHRLGPLDTALSGTVTLIFQLWHTPGSNPVTSILYLDEVSLGGTMGGPHKAYVPLVWKRH
jgi:hypothetical protein